MKTFCLLNVLILFLFANCKTTVKNDKDTFFFVKEGKTANVNNESGSWQTGAEGLTGIGYESFLDSGLCVGTGDFEIFATLKLKDISKDNASFMIDKTETLDPSEFIFSRNGNLVVRGFFFGNRTQTVRPLNGLIKSDEWFNFNIRREGDMVTFYISGESVWIMKYENDRPFGILTFKPGSNVMTVKEFGMRGNTIPLDKWTPLLDREYPVNGAYSTDVFTSGENGYNTYRIPTIVRTNSGTLLAFAEGRKNNHQDHGDVDMVLRRSNDGGLTWQPLELVYEEGDTALVTIGNPVPLVDRTNDRVWLFFCRDNQNVLTTFSDDEGISWSSPEDLTSTLKSESWGAWVATGPCHGIQMANGRLVVPANHGLKNRLGNKPHMIVSDDHGSTWHIGGIPDALANENSIADLGNNQLYVNMRSSEHNNSKPYCRKVAWSEDGGETFGETSLDTELTSSICQGSVLSFKCEDDSNLLLFSNPNSWRREWMTVRASKDNGHSWSKGIRIYDGSSAYSDLVQIDEKTVGLLFEKDTYGTIAFVRFNPKVALVD
jgi:sialidase-1